LVSDFVDEFNGYLRLRDNEFMEARKQSPEIKKEARVLLEYGEGKEGYWTSERFLSQMKTAVTIADIKYPKSEGYKVTWVFDNNTCHTAYDEDALLVSYMNTKAGGKQNRLRDTVWIARKWMKPDDMRKVISTHSDFANEKTKLERFLQAHTHCASQIPL
jgi:hypothetical protein